MPLAAGTRFGPYEILASIGAGGMGEVYKARDTRLDRTVAIKVLPSHIAGREESRQRFEREARAVSSLNHPHICVLHDVGSENGTAFMVMEHLDGETLADRLQRGPLGLDQSLKYSTQIADALDRAHRNGIVHRDLKPGNIMITRDGAKVLDFGLAKTAVKAAAVGETLTAALTSEGTVLGTPQYMSPEQIDGGEADARTDVFAFGCVVYEMTTGKRAFDGKTKSSVLAAILAADPRPMSTLQPVTPTALEKLVRRCLAKDPDDRWHCMRDVVLELRSIEDVQATALPQPPAPARQSWIPWGLAAILLAGVLFLWLRAATPDLRSTQFLLEPPEGNRFTNEYAATAISPDGRYIVFGAGVDRSQRSLWLRPLDSVTARQIAGSEGGTLPFWSPDSKSVAFFAGGKLKRTEIAGGAPLVLCDAQDSYTLGGTWNRDGVIVFGSGRAIFRVPASGGIQQQVTEPDQARKEAAHGIPQFLPDGNRFLFLIASADPNTQGTYAASLDNPKERVRIVLTERKAFYTSSRDGGDGFLLWTRGTTLLAQRFDTKGLRLSGEPVRVVDNLASGPLIRSPFWTSDAGLLVYRGQSEEFRSRLVWVSRDGKHLGEALKEDRYGSFRLSPDASKVAVSRLDDAGKLDIWVFEFGRQVIARLTFDNANEGIPTWSPDGRQIVFFSDRTGVRQMYRKDVSGGDREEQLPVDADTAQPIDWGGEGTHLLYRFRNGIWAMPMRGDAKPVPILNFDGREGIISAQISPDGRWLAYSSSVSGRYEVYVRPFPAPGGQWQVSNDGGALPKWRVDGKELFYVGPGNNRMMAVNVAIQGGKFQSDTPRELFRMAPPPPRINSPYDVAPDGNRFLLMDGKSDPYDVAPLTVVTNWQAGLKK